MASVVSSITSARSEILWQDYCPVMIVDQQYCDKVSISISRVFNFRVSQLKDDRKQDEAFIRSNVLLSGSCSEHTAICRWFRENKPNIEVDIMYKIGIVSEDMAKIILDPLINYPGFFRVRSGEHIYNCLSPFMQSRYDFLFAEENHCPDIRHGDYINTKMLRELCANVLKFKDRDNGGRDTAAKFLGLDGQASLRHKASLTGPSACIELDLGASGMPVGKFSVDNVVCWELPFWPEIANSWLSDERRKHWPAREIVQEIVRQGCHIVPKSPTTLVEGNTEWRLSFSAAERILALSRTPVQYACYFIAKSIYYVHIKTIEVDGKSMSSFILKTCMLWMLEQTQVSHWKKETLVSHIEDLFGILYGVLDRKTLKNYFIQDINLMKDFSDTLQDAVKEKVKDIHISVLQYVPRNPSKIAKEVEKIIGILGNLEQFYNFQSLLSSV